MIRLRAIATLLLGLATLLGHPGKVLADGEGRALYQAVCRACHAPENVMVSAPKAGDTAEWERRLRTGLDQLTDNALNGIGAMPAKGGCTSCTAEQLRDAIRYMTAPVAMGGTGETSVAR